MTLEKRLKVLDVARNRIGDTETPPGSNKTLYGAWYGLDGYPWCTMFVSWCFHHAGVPLEKVDDQKGFRYFPSAYNFWKSTSRLTGLPEPDDIVFFDWEGDGRFDHTGIFVRDNHDGQTFTAIEGNTSVANNSNGGSVMERRRHYALVKAFVNPACYGGASINPPDHRFHRGNRGAGVREFQKKLHNLGYLITVDGEFGAQTQRVVKQFQRDLGVTVDGTVSTVLTGMMDEKLRRNLTAPSMLTTGSFLNPGGSGMAVRLLQEKLNQNGAKPQLKIDGVYGPATRSAVIRFQLEQGLENDGIAGPETLGRPGLAL